MASNSKYQQATASTSKYQQVTKSNSEYQKVSASDSNLASDSKEQLVSGIISE